MDEKMKKFVDAVLSDANAQKEQLLNEINAQKCCELEKAEEEILDKIFLDIKRQISEIKNDFSKKLSKKTLQTKNEILMKRSELTDKVFEKLRAKLLDFTKSAEYKDYLKELLQKQLLNFEGEVFIQSSKSDISLIREILKEIGKDTAVSENSEIIFGGFVIISKQKSFKSDETLDSKLKQTNEVFGEISGLVIS